MTRIILVPGHSAAAPGAGVAPWREYEMHRHTVAHAVARLVGAGIDTRALHRTDTIRGYSAKMAELVARINRLSPAAVVEVHYNAGPVGVGDTLALYWPSSPHGRDLAASISAPIAAMLGTRDRGALPQRESAAGLPLYMLRDTSCPAAILETHHSDDEDAHRLACLCAQDGALGKALADGILAWLESA